MKSLSERHAARSAAQKKFVDARPGYSSWYDMRQRCLNPNRPKYKSYGGRGITIDPRWLGRGGYKRFLEDMGPRPEGTTLDRKDNDGPYTKDNCRWATPTQQSSNRRNSRLVTINGKTETVAWWAAKNGIGHSLAWRRIYELGWDPIRAVTLPAVRGRNQSGP